MTGIKRVLVVAVFVAFGAASPAALASAPTQLSPADGASATAGTPVQFTASDATASTYDLSLQISSSPQTNSDGTLVTPDLTSTAGFMFGTNGQFSTTWTPSNRTAQTVYWTVYREDCSTYPCAKVASPVRTLNVGGIPTPQPVSPANGAAVLRGRDVTFTVSDPTDPVAGLTLGISSSPATNADGTLVNSDLDTLFLDGSGPTFSATSSNATASVRTVYWVVYRFDCVGTWCGNVASPVQKLTVVPPPVSVHLVGPTRFHLNHPTLQWRIRCNVDCYGDSYVRASVRTHGHARHVSRLSLRKVSFNLRNAARFDEVFTKTYRGRFLTLLRQLVAKYGQVRFDAYVRVTDAAGHTSSAHRVLYMLPSPLPPPSRPPSPPAPPPTPPSTACYPLTNSGGCYEPGEYCRETDHGKSGVAGDGEAIICEDNNGWRWEPA